MRILCVIDSLCLGGAERQLVELAIGFNEEGHSVSFLTYHHIPFFNPFLEKNSISITCIQEPNYFKRLLKMRHFIRRGKYDSVLSFLEAPSFICEIAGIPYRKWKLVVGERNSDPDILKSLGRRIFRWFHFLSDYIVANSYSTIQLLYSVNPLLSRSKCKVIYNTIDLNYWKPKSNHIYRKDGKLKLIIAARQSIEKNLPGLIEALALLNENERSKISIEWYGNNLSEPLMDINIINAFNKIKTLNLENLITFFPATSDINAVIQDSDASGLFSNHEGFPNSICEAMACGKPVICSSVSDLPIIISYDLNLLCDPSKPDSIRKSISYLISLSNDQLAQIGMKNAIIAKEKFNKEVIVPMYLQLLCSKNNT